MTRALTTRDAAMHRARIRWHERVDLPRATQLALLCAFLVALLLLVGWPVVSLLLRSVTDEDGRWVGLENFGRYFGSPALVGSLFNALIVSSVSTLIAVSLGFIYAYALTRSRMPGRGVLRQVAMLPLYAPTMLFGIGLVYLFGTQGLVTTGLFGLLPLGWDIGLYGLTGIIIAETVYIFPAVLIILITGLSLADARLHDAADAMGAHPVEKLLTVTLPACRYSLVNAALAGFILSFTDFGAPKIVGGQTNVIALDVYKQVVGQHDLTMGSVVAVVLMLPTVLAFAADRWLARGGHGEVAGSATPLRPRPHRGRDLSLLVVCAVIAAGILLVMAAPAFASLVRVWPYSLSHPQFAADGVFSLRWYDFSARAGNGLNPYFNSLRMAMLTAVIGTVAIFTHAYLVHKLRGWSALRGAAQTLSVLPLALPGLVLGLSYIFVFNQPSWGGLPNPLGSLYGTMALLVISNIIHFLGVSFMTASTALRQLDQAFEPVADSLGARFPSVFLRVSVPVCLPAIFEIAMYLFVSSMATISAVVFLYTAATRPAAVAVLHLDESGDTQSAAAMCVLILLTNIAVRLGYEVVAVALRRRNRVQ